MRQKLQFCEDKTTNGCHLHTIIKIMRYNKAQECRLWIRSKVIIFLIMSFNSYDYFKLNVKNKIMINFNKNNVESTFFGKKFL